MTTLDQHDEPFIEEQKVTDILLTEFLGREYKGMADIADLLVKLGEIKGLSFELRRDLKGPGLLAEPAKWTMVIDGVQKGPSSTEAGHPDYILTSISMDFVVVVCIGRYLKNLYIQKQINGDGKSKKKDGRK